MLNLLLGEGNLKIDVEKNVVEDIAEHILNNTSGHPGFTIMFFHALYEYISTRYVDELGGLIKKNWIKILSSNRTDAHYRLKDEFKELSSADELDTILQPLLNSGVLFSDISLLYEENSYWQDQFIRYGVLQYYSDDGRNERVVRNCISALNLINSFVTRPESLKVIQMFQTGSLLDLSRLVKYLFKMTPEYTVNVREAWVEFGNFFAPSEKSYQTQWYSLLKQMTFFSL